jgi:hypothetical protein
MKLKRFEELNEELSEDKETKKLIQDLRTELNKYKKCIGEIEYTVNHIKTKSYDYGEGYENAITDIKYIISEVKRK